MIRLLYCWCACLLFSAFCLAQEKSSVPLSPRANSSARLQQLHENPEPSAKLPVRRVVLYKNGIGYFEHLGLIRGSQDVNIDFTSAQLNDVLKSLTILDLSGGRITGVDYNSEAPLVRRLATLRLALGEKPTQSEFLNALRGARLEVRTGNSPAVVGKLLSVERKTRSATNFTVETDEISVISDNISGVIRKVLRSRGEAVFPSISIRLICHKILHLSIHFHPISPLDIVWWQLGCINGTAQPPIALIPVASGKE